MEYIIVKVKKGDKQVKNYIEAGNGIKIIPRVTINGIINGSTGKILEVDDGSLEVSLVSSFLVNPEIVKLTLKLNSTTISSPKEIIINVA